MFSRVLGRGPGCFIVRRLPYHLRLLVKNLEDPRVAARTRREAVARIAARDRLRQRSGWTTLAGCALAL